MFACTPEEPAVTTDGDTTTDITTEDPDMTTTTAPADDGTTTTAPADDGTTTTLPEDDGTTTTVAPDADTTTTAAPGGSDDDPDGTPVPIANVIGRPMFTIPVIGYVCYFIQHPPGSFITVAALMIFVILAFVPDLFAIFAQDSKVKAKSDREKEKEELERELERLKSFVKDDSEGKR
jgi:hypothetical protein